MSISDMIVVMKQGVVQQIGRPQDVYDDPVNLFVARFLGTPPINVLTGSVRGGRLFIGDDAVLDAPGVPEGAVSVGVRPEGFTPDAGGALHCALKGIEVMGRDISVVCTNPASEGAAIRAIISAETRVDASGAAVSFALKPAKTFIFDGETGARIRIPRGDGR